MSPPIRLCFVTCSPSDAKVLKEMKVRTLMASYHYWNGKLEHLKGFDFVMDSGAFSAGKDDDKKKKKGPHPWIKFLDDCKCGSAQIPKGCFDLVMLDTIGNQNKTNKQFAAHQKCGHKVSHVFYSDSKLNEASLACIKKSVASCGGTNFAGVTNRYMQARGFGWATVVPKMKQFFEKRGTKGRTHLLGSFNVKVLTEFPFTSADTSSWRMLGGYGKFAVFAHDSKKGARILQLPAPKSKVSDTVSADMKPLRDKAVSMARKMGINLNEWAGLCKWNIRAYKIFEAALNAGRRKNKSEEFMPDLEAMLLDDSLGLTFWDGHEESLVGVQKDEREFVIYELREVEDRTLAEQLADAWRVKLVGEHEDDEDERDGDGGVEDESTDDEVDETPAAAKSLDWENDGMLVDLLVEKAAPDDKRIVMGVVLEPDSVDAQGDTISAQEIERAAHLWLARFQDRGVMHTRIVNSKIEIYESFVAPSNLTIGGQKVKKGSWLLMYHILDDTLWKQIKTGKITGFSMGGFARRVQLGKRKASEPLNGHDSVPSAS